MKKKPDHLEDLATSTLRESGAIIPSPPSTNTHRHQYSESKKLTIVPPAFPNCFRNNNAWLYQLLQADLAIKSIDDTITYQEENNPYWENLKAELIKLAIKDLEDYKQNVCPAITENISDYIPSPLEQLYLSLLYLQEPNSGRHSVDVAIIVKTLLLIFDYERKLFTEAEHDNLIRIGFLHDLGKLNMLTETLIYPGKLTPKQFAEIREHEADSLKIIDSINKKTTDALERSARWATISHHDYPQSRARYESKTNSPYPDNITLKDSILSLLIFLSDNIAALCQERHGRPAKSLYIAKEVIKFNLEKRIQDEGHTYLLAALRALGGTEKILDTILSSTDIINWTDKQKECTSPPPLATIQPVADKTVKT